MADMSQQAVNTPEGFSFFTALQNGNKTLLAPNNAAWSGAQPVTSNDSAVTPLLSYHAINGPFVNGSAFAAFPNVTIVRTLMNDSQVVQLEGNRSQVLVITYDQNTVKILNQKTSDKVLKSWTYQNLVVHEIEAVLNIPPKLGTLLDSGSIKSYTTLVAQAANSAGVIPALESTRGITIFLPNDEAFTKLLANLNGQLPDANTLRPILNNHIINGTTVYSSDIANDSKYTSAGGETFNFTTSYPNGTFITSGNFTAKIVQSDIPIMNGVVHIIDNVLVNSQSDTGAASSAYQSATSSAGTTGAAAETGAVGNHPAPTTGNNNNGNGGTGAASTMVPPFIAATVMAIAGVFVLFI
jgi:uncharacterized surface protein with fasciclin (FAS1) repeats